MILSERERRPCNEGASGNHHDPHGSLLELSLYTFFQGTVRCSPVCGESQEEYRLARSSERNMLLEAVDLFVDVLAQILPDIVRHGQEDGDDPRIKLTSRPKFYLSADSLHAFGS